MKRLGLTFLLLAGIAAAQFTTVSGTVTDPGGLPYANGTITATLVVSASPTLGGVLYTPPSQPTGLSSSGSFVMRLADNTVLLPGGSQWKFTACSSNATVQPAIGKRPICFTAGPVTISGVSQSISRPLNAAALALTVAQGGNSITGSPTGKEVIGTGSAFIPRALPYTDIRLTGVSGIDCTGTSDSTVGLNTLFANGAAGVDGHEFGLPTGGTCVLKIGANGTGVTIRNHMGFKLKGYSQPGDGGSAAFGNFELQWCQSSGASGATMLDMEHVHSFTLEGIVFNAHGPVASGCTMPAGKALNVDLNGTGNLITTFGEFRNNSILGGGYQGASHDPNFIGVQFSAVSASNVEDMRIHDSAINCGTATPGTENTQGIIWGPASFNTHEEWVYFTDISNCRYGQDLGEGQVFVEGGDYSTNGTDFHWRGNAQGGAFISGIESENSGQFFRVNGLGGGTLPLTIRDSDFEPSRNALTNTCGVDLNSNGTIAMMVTLDNFNTGSANASGWQPLCANQNTVVNMRNVHWGTSGTSTASGNSGFVFAPHKNFGATYSLQNGGYHRAGATFAQGGSEDIGWGFYNSAGYDTTGLAYNNDTNDGMLAGGLNIGRDSMYLGNAHVVMKGMWPLPAQTITCTVNGTPGSTNYTAEVYAKDAAGKRSGTAPYVGNANRCSSAQATFSASNNLVISWPAVPNAASGYDVVLLNPANQAQGWLAGTTAQGTTRITITNGPGSFNYSFPAYSESAQTDLNGERFTNNVTYTFATLPKQPNGSQLYCSDCNATCTAGGGTGRTCFRENGTWTH